MQGTSTRDLVVGLFVTAGLLTIAYLSIQVGGVTYKGDGGLTLHAAFDEVGGLKPRAPIAIAGVTVGQGTEIELDDYLRARVTFEVDAGIELPTDTSAGIRTAGLLGDQFIALEPGGEEELLGSGEEIAYTESALSIERLIGKFVHDSGINSD
jgi:phospholipid/cholesterol/gamma-HCH transport system substrate-binding protein